MDAAQRRERDGVLQAADQSRGRARQPGRDLRAAILLAAGRSRRFGLNNKLLAAAPGGTLLARNLTLARAAPAARLIVIVSHDAGRIARDVRIREPRARIVRTHYASQGMGASLAAGVAALWPIEREAFVFVADMQAGDPRLSHRLARAWQPNLAAIRPVVRGVPGHPVLIGGQLLRAARNLGGDRGLGAMIARLPASERRSIVADRRATADVDRRSALHSRVAALR